MKAIKAILIIVAASLIFVTAALAGEMKSDPDNYYLDPEEIRPYVRDSIEATILLNSKAKGTTFGGEDNFDVRLIPGQLPLYTIDGRVAAYLYIAYAFPGPLPTFEEITAGAHEAYPAIKQHIWSVNREENRGEFYGRVFPYNIKCAYEIVGVTDRWPRKTSTCGIPEIIMYRREAEEAAEDFYGTRDYEFVRYIYCSKLNGYEFSGAGENILVPFDTLTGEVLTDSVIRMLEVETDIDEYVYTPNAVGVERYFGKWEDRLRDPPAESRGTDATNSPVNAEVQMYGSWCYLHQQYYDARDFVWRDNSVYGWKENVDSYGGYPLLKRRVPGFDPDQDALFGMCWAIAAASNFAYLEGTVNGPHLWKYEKEGDLVKGIDAGKEYPYPHRRLLCKSLYTPAPGLPPYPNSFAAYMAWLAGAIYQRYDEHSFFCRDQYIINGTKISLPELAQICANMIEDFSSAENYYSVWSKTLLPERTNDLVDLICANNPFVINYDWPGGATRATRQSTYYPGWPYGPAWGFLFVAV